jgi:hypothetical protein
MLSEAQIKQYEEEGFLLVTNFFSNEELQPAIDSINELVSDIANALFTSGHLKDKYENEGFFTRLPKIEQACPGSAIMTHVHGVLRDGFAKLFMNEKSLNIMQQLLGPEIAGHPVWNIRAKVPNNITGDETDADAHTVPWHQDCAYLEPGCENTFTPTMWIPMLDTNETNGCMQVYKGGHKEKIVLNHTCCHAGTWYVTLDEEVMIKELGLPAENIITCPVPKGGFLLINQLIPHRSLSNKSDIIRWTFDFRYHRPDEFSGQSQKKSVLLRSANPDFKFDWGNWKNEKRIAPPNTSKDPNDRSYVPVVSGAWMKRWPIIKHNYHTQQYK